MPIGIVRKRRVKNETKHIYSKKVFKRILGYDCYLPSFTSVEDWLCNK